MPVVDIDIAALLPVLSKHPNVQSYFDPDGDLTGYFSCDNCFLMTGYIVKWENPKSHSEMVTQRRADGVFFLEVSDEQDIESKYVLNSIIRGKLDYHNTTVPFRLSRHSVESLCTVIGVNPYAISLQERIWIAYQLIDLVKDLHSSGITLNGILDARDILLENSIHSMSKDMMLITPPLMTRVHINNGKLLHNQQYESSELSLSSKIQISRFFYAFYAPERLESRGEFNAIHADNYAVAKCLEWIIPELSSPQLQKCLDVNPESRGSLDTLLTIPAFSHVSRSLLNYLAVSVGIPTWTYERFLRGDLDDFKVIAKTDQISCYLIMNVLLTMITSIVTRKSPVAMQQSLIWAINSTVYFCKEEDLKMRALIFLLSLLESGKKLESTVIGAIFRTIRKLQLDDTERVRVQLTRMLREGLIGKESHFECLDTIISTSELDALSLEALTSVLLHQNSAVPDLGSRFMDNPLKGGASQMILTYILNGLNSSRFESHKSALAVMVRFASSGFILDNKGILRAAIEDVHERLQRTGVDPTGISMHSDLLMRANMALCGDSPLYPSRTTAGLVHLQTSFPSSFTDLLSIGDSASTLSLNALEETAAVKPKKPSYLSPAATSMVHWRPSWKHELAVETGLNDPLMAISSDRQCLLVWSGKTVKLWALKNILNLGSKSIAHAEFPFAISTIHQLNSDSFVLGGVCGEIQVVRWNIQKILEGNSKDEPRSSESFKACECNSPVVAIHSDSGAIYTAMKCGHFYAWSSPGMSIKWSIETGCDVKSSVIDPISSKWCALVSFNGLITLVDLRIGSVIRRVKVNTIHSCLPHIFSVDPTVNVPMIWIGTADSCVLVNILGPSIERVYGKASAIRVDAIEASEINSSNEATEAPSTILYANVMSYPPSPIFAVGPRGTITQYISKDKSGTTMSSHTPEAPSIASSLLITTYPSPLVLVCSRRPEDSGSKINIWS